eukprot:gene16959-18668_t
MALFFKVPALQIFDMKTKGCSIQSFRQKLLADQVKCATNVNNTQYCFNYTSESSQFTRLTALPCSTTLIDKTYYLMCKDESLDVCRNKTLNDYFLHINVFAATQSGTCRSKHFSISPSITAPQDELIVKDVKVLAKSPYELNIAWSRPSCKELEFVYKLIYIEHGSNLTFTKKFNLPEYGENKWLKHTIKKLKPFTNYKICLFSLKYYNDVYYKAGACTINSTSQAAPSKAPVIINTVPKKTSSGKWKCTVAWKSVEQIYWNGIVKSTILRVYRESDRALVKQPAYIPIAETVYEIPDLKMDTQYIIKLKICTKGGCSETLPKEISYEQSSNTPVTVIAMLVFAALLVICISAIIYWKYGERRSHNNPVPSRRSSLETLSPEPRPFSENIYDEVLHYGPYDNTAAFPSVVNEAYAPDDNARGDIGNESAISDEERNSIAMHAEDASQCNQSDSRSDECLALQSLETDLLMPTSRRLYTLAS